MTPPVSAITNPQQRAVIYLRVVSDSGRNTDRVIRAQREVCQRAASGEVPTR